MTEQTTYRYAMRSEDGSGAVHRPWLLGEGTVIPSCWGRVNGQPQFVALSETAPEDRCKTCWKDAS